MFKTFAEIPNNPNKEFFADKICQCSPTDVSYGYPPTYPYGKEYWMGTCRNCGNVPPSILFICKYCTSVCTRLFFHPYQTTPNKYCWHCLENGVSTILNEFYINKQKQAPHPELLHPYVKPKAFEDTMDEINQTLDDFFSLFE